MTYATRADMITRFGELEVIQRTDRENLGIINEAVLDQALADATAEIDAYIARYLPLATVPTVLVRNCCDIARYFLFGEQVPEAIQKRFDAVLKYLTAVGKGDISLGVSNVGDVVVAVDSGVQVQSSPSVFGRDASY